METRFESLGPLEAALWRELMMAAHDREHGWHSCVLATHDAHDGPDARTVVLREVDPERRQLFIYTDARSAKHRQLDADARAMLVCWSPQLGWQLRLRLICEVRSEGLDVTSRWAQLRSRPSARDYLAPLAPGVALPDDPARQPQAAPTSVERTHFALIGAQVLSVDWLELHRDGHRRARFDAHGARWLQP
ncbi:pyridoxamine 5'-phosphate oxidase family protein [Caldimonas sp. KR1-144]|uniref:pyridoxamine 5'-phosphate oxidase family protein n=1 Tax=Caldimonas sp. KR1-144 TaxID=3400911 RepID=UPI003BFF18F4